MSNLIARPKSTHRRERLDRFRSVRAVTEQLAAPLSAEDQTVQSMNDTSPTKWHLAHTTWFFETFVLRPRMPGYRVFDSAYDYLFNSYYEAVGPRHPRPHRGMITRPGVAEVMAYREHVTEAMVRHLTAQDGEGDDIIELGLHHEEQHQELILMDAKHLLSLNPLRPAYLPAAPSIARDEDSLRWIEFEGGLVETGHDTEGFAFDNESPRHRSWLDSFALAMRPVSCGEYLSFMQDGGYRRPELWLSAGWDCVKQRGWEAPLYWERKEGSWTVFVLSGGLRALDPTKPVCHVSFFEAAAFAKWAGKRLPREAEWELGSSAIKRTGEVWEWTASPYVAYPGYREPEGAIGEYNGKFMANQMVLRGGCSATPAGHVRATYRNFFPPDARWMFGGIRLAEDLR